MRRYNAHDWSTRHTPLHRPPQGPFVGRDALEQEQEGGSSQQLWGLELQGPGCSAGCDIVNAQGVRVGRVTSVTVTHDGQHYGLGLVEKKALEGLYFALDLLFEYQYHGSHDM